VALLLGGSAAVATLAGPGHASAAEPSDTKRDAIAVLPIAVKGELAPAWRERLQARLLEGIERGALRVVSPSDVIAAHPEAAACDDAPCLRAAARAVGARWIVRPRVEVRGRDFRVDIELHDGEDGHAVAQTGEACEVCAVDEVAELLADHAGVLERKRAALEHAVPVVKLESDPPGAALWVDDELVGTAPLSFALAAGVHRVRAELRGHLALEQRVEVVAGAAETVRFDLQRVPRRQILWRWGFGLLGVSTPVLGVGVALLVLDERPYRRRCSGDYVDALGNCRLRYDTLAAGAATTSIAAAGLVAASVLLVLGRPRKGSRARARLLPTTGPGVAVVGAF
jgi:hypothetical protein